MSKTFEKISESGRSLVEMLAVIAVISVITIGGVTGISFVRMIFVANQIHSEVEEITRGVSDLYSWTRDFSTVGNMMTTICDNDISSKKCDKTKSYWTNPFGGHVTVVSGGDSFKIVYPDVPERVCKQLLCETVWTIAKPTKACNDNYCSGTKTIEFIPQY
ncbi:MAG: hypothetical protein LBU87_04795 [Lactobacillales bacterium]|jgi:hypothetical protein|nr:hypothetical protein [Lactobacillales bacterium]